MEAKGITYAFIAYLPKQKYTHAIVGIIIIVVNVNPTS